MKNQLLLTLSALVANKLSVNALEVGTVTNNKAVAFDQPMSMIARDGRDVDQTSVFETMRLRLEEKRAQENADKEHPFLTAESSEFDLSM